MDNEIVPKNPESKLVRKLDDLPSKIRTVVREQMSPDETIVVATPTRFRPTEDMPYSWIVVTTQHLMICNSHKTRGMYARHAIHEINDIRVVQSSAIRILLQDPSHGDYTLPLDASPGDLTALIDSTQFLVGGEKRGRSFG